MLFNYKWQIADGYPVKGVEKSNLKVFSTFACGGGSTMGYKLAGFDVIGANDIDPEMQKVYVENHKPKHYFLCPIGDLLTKELPEELFNLDVLDGSPPCSTFSMAGLRDKAWKIKKKFKEGQAEQVLSDLFFDFIALADRLQPKVIIAENVKGMLMGNAKAYTREVLKAFDDIGYQTQLFLLDASFMGVPQRRKRVFFICTRKDLKMPKMSLSFNEPQIIVEELEKQCKTSQGKKVSKVYYDLWRNTPLGKSLSYSHPKGSFFNSMRVHPKHVLPTIASTEAGAFIHYSNPNLLSDEMIVLGGSFPTDYNFLKVKPRYLVGMSVPPVMTAQVAYQVRKQLFKI